MAVVQNEDGSGADGKLLDELAKANIRHGRRRPGQQISQTITEAASAAVTRDALPQRDGGQPTVKGLEIAQLVDRAPREEVGIVDRILCGITGNRSTDADKPGTELLEAFIKHVQPEPRVARGYGFTQRALNTWHGCPLVA